MKRDFLKNHRCPISSLSHGDPAVVARSAADATKLRHYLRRRFRSIKSETNFARELTLNHSLNIRTSASFEVVASGLGKGWRRHGIKPTELNAENAEDAETMDYF